MDKIAFITGAEKEEFFSLYKQLYQLAGDSVTTDNIRNLKKYLTAGVNDKKLIRNNFGMNPIIRDLRTALVVADEIGMKGSGLTGIMLHAIVKSGVLTV